jgi:PAS domain S-box-containing protein
MRERRSRRRPPYTAAAPVLHAPRLISTADARAAECFRRVFEDGPIPMALVGDDYRLAEVNDAFCRLTGYTADYLADRTFSDITHPDDVGPGLFLARRVFDGEVPGGTLEKRYVRPTGEVVWVELTVSVIRDEQGRPLKGLAIAQAIGERRQELAREQSERTARERVQAAEAERARWARELHDETLQGLAGLHVLLSSALRAGSPNRMQEQIGHAQEQIENEMEKLRGLISELRPAALDEFGLEASVRDLADRTQAVYGIDVETVLELHGPDGTPRRLAQEVETAAYRIVQEGLSNAARHAGASRVVVELRQRGGSVDVRVRDDGHGFDPANGAAGFGLRGMRERVDLLEGRLWVESRPGSGTEVAAVLPVTDPG